MFCLIDWSFVFMKLLFFSVMESFESKNYGLGLVLSFVLFRVIGIVEDEIFKDI